MKWNCWPKYKVSMLNFTELSYYLFVKIQKKSNFLFIIVYKYFCIYSFRIDNVPQNDLPPTNGARREYKTSTITTAEPLGMELSALQLAHVSSSCSSRSQQLTGATSTLLRQLFIYKERKIYSCDQVTFSPIGGATATPWPTSSVNGRLGGMGEMG